MGAEHERSVFHRTPTLSFGTRSPRRTTPAILASLALHAAVLGVVAALPKVTSPSEAMLRHAASAARELEIALPDAIVVALENATAATELAELSEPARTAETARVPGGFSGGGSDAQAAAGAPSDGGPPLGSGDQGADARSAAAPAPAASSAPATLPTSAEADITVAARSDSVAAAGDAAGVGTRRTPNLGPVDLGVGDRPIVAAGVRPTSAAPASTDGDAATGKAEGEGGGGIGGFIGGVLKGLGGIKVNVNGGQGGGGGTGLGGKGGGCGGPLDGIRDGGVRAPGTRSIPQGPGIKTGIGGRRPPGLRHQTTGALASASETSCRAR